MGACHAPASGASAQDPTQVSVDRHAPACHVPAWRQSCQGCNSIARLCGPECGAALRLKLLLLPAAPRPTDMQTG